VDARDASPGRAPPPGRLHDSQDAAYFLQVQAETAWGSLWPLIPRANIFHDLFSERGKVRLNSAATGPADGSRVARPRAQAVLDVPRAPRLRFLTIIGWVNGNKDVPNIPPRPAQPKRKLPLSLDRRKTLCLSGIN